MNLTNNLTFKLNLTSMIFFNVDVCPGKYFKHGMNNAKSSDPNNLKPSSIKFINFMNLVSLYENLTDIKILQMTFDTEIANIGLRSTASSWPFCRTVRNSSTSFIILLSICVFLDPRYDIPKCRSPS